MKRGFAFVEHPKPGSFYVTEFLDGDVRLIAACESMKDAELFAKAFNDEHGGLTDKELKAFRQGWDAGYKIGRAEESTDKGAA